MTLADIETGELVEQPNLWLDDAVGHHVAGNLTQDEALTVTAKIKAYAGTAWLLLYAAHERKAHKALGYKTWEAYVRAEFDIGRSQSYRLLSQARVVLELAEASTDVDTDLSTMVDTEVSPNGDTFPVPNEAQSRELAKLPTPEAKHDAWTEAVDAAVSRGGSVTAQDVADAVERRLPPPESAPTTAGEEGEDTATRSAPSEPDAETVARAVERGTDPDLTYRVNVDKALGKAHDLVQMDVERAIATAGESGALHRQLVQSIHRWCDRYLKEVGRPDHLRSVK